MISDPDTIALYGLSKIPQYSVSGNTWSCTLHFASPNNLWNQIPNMARIKSEGDNLINIYNKCSMIGDLQTAANDINSRISNYANTYSVQLFYQKYDEWNTRGFLSGCTWYDKSFDQRCGAGSDGSKESAGYGSMVNDFINDMRKYLHTDYFSSKIVVSN